MSIAVSGAPGAHGSSTISSPSTAVTWSCPHLTGLTSSTNCRHGALAAIRDKRAMKLANSSRSGLTFICFALRARRSRSIIASARWSPIGARSNVTSSSNSVKLPPAPHEIITPNTALPGFRFVAMAAREIQDGEVCFVGIGVPSLAAMTAKRAHAPGAVLIYESGAVDADPPIPPLSTGSPSVVANTAMVTSCLGVFAMLQQGRFDVGLLSGAQVDRYGNLNSTVLGRATSKRKVRLVGSGGAHDIALLAREVIIMMPHDHRRFVSSLDYVTTPGLRTRENGLASMHARGRGPKYLITPRARFTFESGELTLEALADGVDESQALEGFSWTVTRTAHVRPLPPIETGLAHTAAHLLELWGRDVT